MIRRFIRWWCEAQEALAETESHMTPEQRAYAYWMDRHWMHL